jgi:hypothetical protein
MYFDAETNLWRSHTSDRVLTVEQYEARCAQGRIAAKASKDRAAYIASPEYQQEVAAMETRSKDNRTPMHPLPGGDPGWYIFAGGFRRTRRS